MRHIAAAILCITLPLGSVACLPDDTRPPPGRADVTVTANDDLIAGFTTSDGYAIAFDAFLLSFGEVSARGEKCAEYAESDYIRVLDMLRSGSQKLATVYALGPCDFEFRMQRPPARAILGEGVTETQKAALRAPGSDPFVQDRGVALLVAGTASKGAARYRFDWAFRRSVEYTDCANVTFRSEQSFDFDFDIRASVLFRDTSAPEAEPVFEPFVLADADADGDITLEELAAAPIEDPEGAESLGALVYFQLVPEVPRPPEENDEDCTILEWGED